MADELEEFLRGPAVGSAPVVSGAGKDELETFLTGGSTGAEEGSLEKFLTGTDRYTPAAGPVEYFSTLGSLAAGGVKRNLEQWRAMPSSLGAIKSELEGDVVGAQAKAQEAQGILKAAGEGEWSLGKIHDAESFSYWLAEKLGEQGITALATLGTGGIAGLGVNAVGRTLMEKGLLSAAGNRALTLSGMALPTYGLSTAMETAGTSQEQFEVTGNVQPGISITSGATKGLLELYAPMSIARALLKPGLQLGKTLPGAIGRTMVKEGSTETAQEAVDIYARKLSDPGYSYFKDGFTLAPEGWGEGMWRLAEAGVAGAAVGGVYGAPFAGAERAQVRREAAGDLTPGERRDVPITAYHGGMIEPGQQLDPAMAGSGGADDSFQATFLSSDKNTAKGYGRNVVETQLDPARLKKVDFEQILRQEYAERGLPFDPAKADWMIPPEVVEQAKREGFGGLALVNARDAQGRKQTEYAVWDKAAVKQQRMGPQWVPQMPQEIRLLPSVDGVAREGTINKSTGQLMQGRLIPGNENPAWTGPFDLPVEHPDRQKAFINSLEEAKRLLEAESNKIAQDRRRKFTAITGGVGPVTALRRAVMRPAASDKLIQESRGLNGRDDALSLGPLLGTLPGARARERWLDLVEANTPRYAEPGSTRIFTDTELELEFAINRPQSAKPNLVKVRQDLLQPAATTATVQDLPSAASGRVWFLPDVKPAVQQQLLQQYEYLQNEAKRTYGANLTTAETRREFESRIQPQYEQLVTAGLRVVPSRGAGFHYNGVLEGEPVADLTQTQRSRKIALYDPVSQQITPFKYQTEEELALGFGNTAERAVPVSVDTNRMQAEDAVDTGDGSFRLKAPLDPSKLTPGISFVNDPASHPSMMQPEHLGWGASHDLVQVEFIYPETQQLAKSIESWSKGAMPGLRKVLNSLGIKQKLGIRITDAPRAEVGISPASAEADTGVVAFYPQKIAEFIAGYAPGTDIKQFLTTALMHELGHLVTYHHYHQLPVEVKEKLWYAWDKARLAFRMGDQSRTQSSLNAPGLDQAYWTSFPEWLAEQFRRWSTSNADAKGWMDSALQGGAQALSKFYASYKKEFGSQMAVNLAEPDYHFSAFMDYVRGQGSGARSIVKRQAVRDAPNAGFTSPAAQRIIQQVELALRTAQGIVPPEVQVRINEALDPHVIPGMHLPATPEAMGRWIPDGNLIEIATGALPKEALLDSSRQVIVHEIMHAYEDLGIISQSEIEILMRDIKGKESRLFPLAEQAALRNRVKEYGQVHGWTEAQIQRQFELMRDKELRAYYIQQYADTGFAFSEQGGGIMSWILALIRRVQEFLRADGHVTAEDVRKAFFKGEMLARRDQATARAAQAEAVAMTLFDARDPGRFVPHASYQDGEFTVKVRYNNWNGQDKASGDYIVYQWLNAKGQFVGTIELDNKMPKGFNIEWIENKSDHFALGLRMVQMAERDLGIKIKVAGQLTEEGFAQAKVLARAQGQKNLLDLFTKVKVGDTMYWVSPHKAKELLAFWAAAAKATEKGPVEIMGLQVNQRFAIQQMNVYNAVLKGLPLDVWKDPRLEQMFSLKRNHAKDGVEGSLIRSGQEVEESKLLASMGMGEKQPDAWRQSFEQAQHLSQAANARASGLPFELSAPSTALTFEIRKLWERATGYGSSREAERELINVAHEADRIGKFTKYAWTLDQLAIANERATNIGGLLDLVQHKEQMNMLQNAWVQRADQTAKAWEQVTNQARRDAIIDVLFSLSEMNYLPPAERAAKVKRLPTGWVEFMSGQPPPQGSELFAEFYKAKVRMADHGLIRRVHLDFGAFLADVESVSRDVLTRKFQNSPQVLQTALTQLAADMQEYRSRPYFPMMRFGEFITTVRENGKMVASYAYPTIAQRDAALPGVRRQWPLGDMQVGKISGTQAEFMSLPGPLLKLIKENLFDKTGKTPEQQVLIDKQMAEMEELELLHMPDRTFRKRWMPSQGVPGYSLDAFRAYSHYFQYGSRYLSRMAYMDQMQNDISRLRESLKTVGNMSKRAEIVKYAEDWLKYILEPGRDSGKFRAIVSLWYLGFSPAAAFMNVTQNITTTWPWLSGKFGSEAQGAFVRATNARLWRQGLSAASFAGYQKAHEEMVRQGFIDMGQAPELAAFAEGHNLNKLMALGQGQKAWRNLSYWGMYMFAAVESYNREVAMRAAWDLAIRNPNNARLKELDLLYPLEVADLIARTGMSHAEAVAFMFAKETIKRTQFVYDKTSDPPFMRGKAKDFLIFFKYTQGMLFAFGYNGAMVQMLLTMAVLYGLAGVPGAEDANEVLKLIAQKLFGKDFDVLKSAREMVKGISRGTPFENAGPDLALHGISRYGFGLGLLPDHWGAPRFDASANGSMGKIVPGLYEFAHGLSTGQKFSDTFAQSAQRVSGAGYGTFYTIMQTLMEAPSAESHKWEQLLQRQMKALAKTYRYGVDPQAETTRQGSKIVKFDASDPDDVATVIAQAFGFTPLKVSKTWDAIRATKEEMAVWDMRRQALYVQFDRVLQEQPVNSQALEDMLKAIRKYNEDVPDPIYSIKAQELSQSLRQRHKARAMQEQTLGANRREAIVSKRMQDLYGVEPPRPVK